MTSSFDLAAQQQDIDSKLTAGLERLLQALRVLLWDKAKVEGLSPIQLQILVQLKYHAEAERRVSALAQRFDLSKATISDAVKTLEQKGFVNRHPDPQDARASILELTATGADVASTVETWAERAREVIATLPANSKRDTLQLVMTLIDQFQTAGIITVANMCLSCRFFRKTPTGDDAYYCNFLEKPLAQSELRVDCPEYKAA